LLLFLLCIIKANAQYNGYPIRNYSPKEYKGFMQTWDCVQDNRGVLYFGNSTNILEYDGNKWRKIFVSNGVAIRVLHNSKNGKIYVGSVGEFGYLKPNEKGEIIYQSLLHLLTDENKKFSDIWAIHEIDDAIVFQASENLFIYQNDKIKIIPPEKNSFASGSFTVGDKIYLRERKIGLKQFDGRTLQLVSNGEKFANEPIIGMVNFPKTDKNNILAISVDNGFFTINKETNEIKKINPSSDKTIIEIGPIGLKWLNDSTLILNTRGGIYFLNKQLDIIRIINKSDGLTDESISNIFMDSQNELWLCTNNGISKVSINSPFYFYNSTCGFNGNIEAITIFDDKLFIGTTSGMYASPLNKNNTSGSPNKLNFKPIEGTYFEVWNFHAQDKKIYAATSDGVFEINNYKTSRITKAYTNSINKSKFYENRIYTAEKDGIRILEKNNDSWKQVDFITVRASDIMAVCDLKKTENNDLILWATTRNSGLLKIVLNKKQEYKLFIYDSLQGAPKGSTDLAEYNGKLYFHTAKDVYEYLPELDNEKQKCFKQIETFGVTFNHNGNNLELLNASTEEGKQTTKALLSIEDQGYTYYQNSSSILWIGLTDAFIRYDAGVQKNYSPNYNALIRRVVAGKDSLLFAGSFINDKQITQTDDNETLNLSYKYNSLTFDYSAPFFEKEDKTLFSYKLIGFDTAWSEWSSNVSKQYTNLYEGEYTFNVKAKNIYNHESSIASYKFKILPPWYRTIWAYFTYFIVLILVIIIIVRLSVRQLRIAKIKLERTVSERTAEVVKQKEELQKQNDIIEIAYNDIKSSINYAKRIQEAILPLKEEIKKHLPQSFVLFKPRDVVSGDFYWFTKHKNNYIIACVDCTGHGVPGAFMSMIGNTLLNEIVIEKNILTASEILNVLHERVRQSLKQDLEQSETRDGMDIAICIINENKTELQYAGANRSLVLIREQKLQEIKADKKPIGGDQMNESRIFTNHIVSLQKNDCIYMSTDGYADQFGGEKGKKFMVKRLHQLLIDIQNNSMEDQSNILDKTITEWQGSTEQVDDILVIGIKI